MVKNGGETKSNAQHSEILKFIFWLFKYFDNLKTAINWIQLFCLKDILQNGKIKVNVAWEITKRKMSVSKNHPVVIIFMILQWHRTQSCKWKSMWEANNTPNIGPGSLRALPVVADGSESGHRFYIDFL